MNWFIVILLSLFGIVMGLLSVKGMTKGIEPFLWVVLGIFVVIVLAKNPVPKFFLQAFVIGLMWGILNSLMAVFFFQTYLSNNPQVVAQFQTKGGSVKPGFFLMMGPIIGVVTGLALGGLTWVAKKIF